MPAQAGIQYSETLVMELKTRGVPDTAYAGMTAVRGRLSSPYLVVTNDDTPAIEPKRSFCTAAKLTK